MAQTAIDPNSGAGKATISTATRFGVPGAYALACLLALSAATGLLVMTLRNRIGLPPALAVHAAFMIAAWGVMMPAGAVVARYFKLTPGQDFPATVDSPHWWNWHRGLQYGGIALSSLALGAVLSATGGAFDTWHGRCGLVVMAIGWLQVLSALLRGTKGGATDRRADPDDPATWRGDHYDMSARRLAFESWHKRAGWAVIVLAAVTILLGIDLVGAPDWLLVVAGALQGATLCAMLDGALRHRWVDTYQALWGPDVRHPGNRRVSASSSPRRRPRSPR